MPKLRSAVPLLLLILFAERSPLAEAATLRVPEDHKTIQAAINAAASGDTVLVGPGTYRERIQLKDKITLRSAGDDTQGKLGLMRAEQTIIDGTDGNEDSPGIAMAEDATLDGFTVTGIGTYDEEAWNQHHASQGEEQSEEHIGKPGIAGISVIGIADCRVINNIVHHVGYTGIVIIGAEGKRVSPKIRRNVTYRNMGGGIGVMTYSSPTVEANTCFENFYAGIGHANHASPMVINNSCYGNIRAGIGISEGSSPVVRGNKCYENRRAGIGIRTGKDTAPLVEHNECYDNHMAGIGVREDATPTLRLNRCYRNREAGIGCRTGASPVIERNDCFENEMSGIGAQQDARPIIVGNHCFENQKSGIGIRDKAKAIVIRNRCADNKTVAIGVQNESQVQIIDNQLSRTGGMPPMIAIQGSSRASISNNIITGGGVAGVLVQGTATISGNHFHGNGPRKGPGPPNFAVWVHEGSSVDFIDNQIEGWRHALFASKAEQIRAIHNTTRRFMETAIVIHDSTQPANAFDNIALSDGKKDESVRVTGQQAVVTNNILRPEKDTKDALPE